MGNLSSAFEKADTSAICPYSMMNLIPLLGFHFQIANSRTRWHCNFKGLSQDRGLTDFSEQLCTSLFQGDLSNEPTFSQIYLAGQYLSTVEFVWTLTAFLSSLDTG
jgi:hypothetical protein